MSTILVPIFLYSHMYKLRTFLIFIFVQQFFLTTLEINKKKKVKEYEKHTFVCFKFGGNIFPKFTHLE